ncbi:MAG: nucleotidyltransferase family protein [Pacificimonas sp.]
MKGGVASALVLAGRREGVVDAFAAAHGVDDKCLIPVGGRPMIAHVVSALAEVAGIDRIVISANDPAILRRIPLLNELETAGRLVFAPASDNIADSVVRGAEGAVFPLLVTTADNVLFDPASVREFGEGAARQGADVAVAFAPRQAVRAAHPDGQKRFYEFSDVAVSTCNAYWLAHERALGAVEAFRGGGQFVKHPARIARAFGIMNLIRFRFGMGRLDETFLRFSRRFGLDMRAVLLSRGACAIDVDNDRTLRVTEEVLSNAA